MEDRCGAKTRSGTKCKRGAMENGRCAMHGGKSPGGEVGNNNALKHGFYTEVFTESEHESSAVATITDAVRAAYIQHKRMLAYMAANKDDMDDTQIARYHDLADKALGRIAHLEKTRAELIGDIPPDPEEPDKRYL